MVLLMICLMLTACGRVPDGVVAESGHSEQADDRPLPASFALSDVRIFDGVDVVERGDVVVRGGVIAEIGEDLDIPPELDVFDGEGKTAMPGLIDSHTHSSQPGLRNALRFGVTTELDMFSDYRQIPTAVERRESLAPTDLADMWSAGILVTAPGGHGTQFGLDIPTLTSPSRAESFVTARVAEGSDYIKLVLEPSASATLSPEEAAAVVQAAHDNGTLAIAHVSTLADAKAAVEAGVDGLAHVFRDLPVDDEFVAAMVEEQVFVISTLLISGGGCDHARSLLDDPLLTPLLDETQRQTLATGGCDYLAAAFETIQKLQTAGVPVLAGTDSPVPSSPHGVGMLGELELLVESGLSPIESLIAGTSLPAEIFGLGDRGRLRVGMRADILLVDGNPTRTITDVRRIERIWKNGYEVDREP